MLLQSVDMHTPTLSDEQNYLKPWRLLRGLTQEKLGEMVGTTGTVISSLEKGQRQLSAKWLRKLGAALEVSPGWIIDHHPDDIPNDVLALWESIPKDDRPHALRALGAFKLVS